MLGDWFRTIELPISFEEFTRLPRHPAYTHEYYGGRAVITPWPRYQRAVLDLGSLSTPSPTSGHLNGVGIRSLQPVDWAHLRQLLAASFHGVPPFATLDDDLRFRAAADCVEHTRTGGDGPLVEPACFMAEDAREKPALVGAILITFMPTPGPDSAPHQQPHLTWVLVHPWHWRQGLGTALLTRAGQVLRGLGYRELATTFLAGNERSALWHWRNGFRLLPDPWSLRLGNAVR